MQKKSTYWIIGFMLFALFFGAGNLIFPAYLGIYSG
ncbi:branched-chain amino acid transport system II carrier protein, partial [Streptococcus sobrinus]